MSSQINISLIKSFLTQAQYTISKQEIDIQSLLLKMRLVSWSKLAKFPSTLTILQPQLNVIEGK